MSGHDPALASLGGAHRLVKAIAVLVGSTVAAGVMLVVVFGQDSVAVAAALGLASGAVLVAGLAYARALTRRASSAAEISELLATPLLAALPAPPKELSAAEELVTLAQPSSVQAQRFRRLVEELGPALADLRSVLITSPDPGQGKSTTAANLAVELARSGRRVAIVDLDHRRPRLHRLFRLFRTPGVAEVAAGELGLDDCLVPIDLAIGTRARRLAPSEAGAERLLYVLPSGAAQPHVAPEPDGALIRALEQAFSIVIVDGPPLLHVPEAERLGALVSRTVVVAGIGTSAAALAETVELLEAAAAHRLGCVVTAAATRGRRYRYEDYYGWDEELEVAEASDRVEQLAGLAEPIA